MITLGKKIEMFTDDYLIGTSENVLLTLNRPVCREKVLTFEKLWEGAGSLGLTVFNDGEQIRMYYRGFPSGASDLDDMQTSCLAVSKDGIHFERVDINKIDYKGIKENNIVYKGVEAHNFSPFYDENPDCPPNEKYKAIGGILSTGGIHIYASADGINWHELEEKAVITDGAFDSMNTAFYDRNAKKYRCYSRYFTQGDWHGFRAIQSCTSEDFHNWSKQTYNNYIGQDEIYEHFYTNATRPVPGAEHMLVSIPMRFAESRKKLPEHNYTGVSDCVLMTSRDGINWNRPFKEAWIYGGLTPREWTQRCFITMSGIIPVNDDFSFYIMKNYMWDNNDSNEGAGIWRYTIPAYRFASVYAGAAGGEFTTKPFIWEDESIGINYNTSAVGFIKAAVIGADGFGFDECGEIFGNELSHEITWNGKTLKEFNGKEIKLAFKLNDAYLYAIKGN
ncbi:MAG: hypothetical protein ACYCWE_06300 [Eubacteriales bacterium]